MLEQARDLSNRPELRISQGVPLRTKSELNKTEVPISITDALNNLSKEELLNLPSEERARLAANNLIKLVDYGQFVYSQAVDKDGNYPSSLDKVEGYVIELAEVGPSNALSSFVSLRVKADLSDKVKKLHAEATMMLAGGAKPMQVAEKLIERAKARGVIIEKPKSKAQIDLESKALTKEKKSLRLALTEAGDGEPSGKWEQATRFRANCYVSAQKGHGLLVREDKTWMTSEGRERLASYLAKKTPKDIKFVIIMQGSKEEGEEQNLFIANLLDFADRLRNLVGEDRVVLAPFNMIEDTNIHDNPLLVDWYRKNHCGISACSAQSVLARQVA